jgi:hypothetical protein
MKARLKLELFLEVETTSPEELRILKSRLVRAEAHYWPEIKSASVVLLTSEGTNDFKLKAAFCHELPPISIPSPASKS